MTPAKGSDAVLLDERHVAALREQVAKTVQDARRRPWMLEKLLARDALLGILDEQVTQLDDDNGALTIDVAAGYAADYTIRELLGILDLRIDGWLVAAYPMPVENTAIWLNRAQVEAQSAPDLWVVVRLDATLQGVRGQVLGWQTRTSIAGMPAADDGSRQLYTATLKPAAELLGFLNSAPPQRANLTPDERVSRSLRTRLQLARAGTAAGLPPLSRMSPYVFDCLLVDQELAVEYMALLDGWPDVLPVENAPEYDTIEQRIDDLVHQGRYDAAMRLLNNTSGPRLLDLLAMVQSLMGNLRESLRTARSAFHAAPDLAFSLFRPIDSFLFALAWQYASRAAAAAEAVEIIDAADPQHDPSLDHDLPRLIEQEGRTFFSLGADLPLAYAGANYRVFLLSPELLERENLEDQGRLRQAFSFKANPSLADRELEHVLVVEAAVRRADGGLIEGKVDASGHVDIFTAIESLQRRPELFFENKTVILLIYREPQGDA